MKKMLSLVGAAMLLAPCSAVMAQQYFVRVGGAHISPHSTASDVAGPMLPPPPSGIGLEVQSAITLYFTVARSINDNLESSLRRATPPPTLRPPSSRLHCQRMCWRTRGRCWPGFGRLRPPCS